MGNSPYLARASSLSRLHEHTQTHHLREDFHGRVNTPTHRPRPDNTPHSQQTDIHAAGKIWTHNPSKRAVADPRLRPRGHWDRHKYMYTVHNPITESIAPTLPLNCTQITKSLILQNIMNIISLHRGTWGCVVIKATSRTVPESIAGGVAGIFSDVSPSDRTMALGSTYPLVKMSTRNISWGVKAAGVWGWRPYHLHVPNVIKIWESKSPGTLWVTPGLLQDSFTFISLYRTRNLTETACCSNSLRMYGFLEKGCNYLPIFHCIEIAWCIKAAAKARNKVTCSFSNQTAMLRRMPLKVEIFYISET
jgi:hypothetical protein